MRAEAISFDDIFRIDEGSGRICLGGDRYIMFDADALGNMRRELIENLGLEVAHGILARVGFQSGRNDARQLKERYPWPSDQEWLLAGPRLHFLEGMVKVRLLHLDMDRSAGKFSVSGEWLDSYEAEQHLKHYGIGDATVCWSLEGYATGYATEFFGEEVVCIEEQCVGKGDPVCRFELKTAREWGKSAAHMQELLVTERFSERFDRCLRAISQMGCELEQNSLDAIFTTDRRGIITSCSLGGSELLGLLPGEALGRSIADFYADGSTEAHQVMQRLVAEGRLRNYFTSIRNHRRREIPIALSASVIRNNLGEIVGTLGVAHDLTDLRKLEDELSAKNRFMANILQDSVDAIITLDSNDFITSWNRGAELIFGYTAKEMLGKSLNVLVPADLKSSKELRRVRDRLRTQGALRSYQTERITKDGRRIQVIFTRTAIRDASGNLIGSSTVLKDITAAFHLERQLADAEHLASLGELSAGLAHEIKNPLAGIKGAIEVIRDTLSSKDIHRDILGDVLQEVDRIDRTVRDLLNYAKPKPPTHSDIHLPEMADRILAMLRKSAKGKESLRFNLEVKNTIPSFTGDEMQLEQVLMNLILNARAAISNSGKVDVRLAYADEEAVVRLEVEDNGHGIPEELLKKIFQPFFTTRPTGTGLGLATCRKNVQYHGGSIEVYSEAGKGARFVVSIPLLSRL